MTKILIFNWRDIKNPEAGGSELYLHELAKRWAEKGNKITFICGGWKNCKKEEIVDNIKIIRVGGKFSLYALAPIAYFKLKNKPDIIIDVENGLPFFSPLFSRKKKLLHIHHVHKEVWNKEMSVPFNWIGYFLEMKIMPFVYRHTKIVTISKSSAKEIEDENIGKVFGIVNPGVEFYEYKKQGKNKNPTIFFLNRMKKYKGLKIMLDAVKEIQNDNEIKSMEILVGGDGEYLQEMIQYTKEKKIEKVNFLGRISEEKKVELMQKSWIFLNPSFKEGWGIVNIEANYLGTPVIGSDIGGIRDSIVNNKTGLLFEYGNHKELAKKIKLLLKNKTLREKMEKEGKKWSKNFSWDIKAEEYLKILKRV
jgi:glycosyltransferase involved in cell wall biosynthesis